MYRVFCVLIVFSGIAFPVRAQQILQAAIIRETVLLDSLPSGSGMAIDGDSLYVVGDDATEIFKTGLKALLFYQPIPMNGVGHLYRMPPDRKRDFEAAFISQAGGVKKLIAVPSGSISPQRDSAFAMHISTPGKQRNWSLRPLYNAICAKAGIPRDQLNIEGAFMSGGRVFLLNRATNHILSFPESAFFMQKGKPDLSGLHRQKISLPELNGVPAHFSDACVLDERNILFSASVEDAPGVAADGPLLGSYIGHLRLAENGVFRLVDIYPVAGAGGSSFTGKIEAVVPLPVGEGQAPEVLAITDNDDGQSQLLRIAMPMQKE